MPRGAPPKRRLVTLTTDIGWAYAAQMKAVLYRDLPAGSVVDLAHDLPAHRIGEAAIWLAAMAERFPAGTIHLAIVDPGVGGERAAVIVECRDGSALVGPDNGLLFPLAQRLGVRRVWAIDRNKLDAPPRRGTTFDGRDLFAPAARTVWHGRRYEEWAAPTTLKELGENPPRRGRERWRGEVILVDRFGNLITNLPSEGIPKGPLRLQVGRFHASRAPFVASYEALGCHGLGCLASSFGTLEISVREGSAARRTGARRGTRVLLGQARTSVRA
jgi:S-adenosylmethionine hydrolase